MAQQAVDKARNPAQEALEKSLAAAADPLRIDEARRVAKGLVGALKGRFDFKGARALIGHALAAGLLGAAFERWLRQQLALCTYKDEELPPEQRFRDALVILDGLGLRDPACRDPETLGLGGAVYKRKWEHGGQLEDLQCALHFYRSGWQRDAQSDMGYCGVNAAYILDLMRHRARIAEARESIATPYAAELEDEARALREEMRKQVPAFAEARGLAAVAAGRPGDDPRGQWWYLVTMAEVAFGLGEWAEAETWLTQARDAQHSEWETQTTAKQLVTIARLRELLPPDESVAPGAWTGPWKSLYALLGADAGAAFDSHRGKVGLALSGGGFRASFFHLGVLARLAECDVLRSVEVLSTVSGGSIVGAHYYLELRHLLQTKTDAELTREDYVLLVRRVMDDFLAGVQMNLRTRALASLWCNLKMLFSTTYTRSNRIGELYDEHLYNRVRDDHWEPVPRRMRDLLVHPLLGRKPGGEPGERDETFKPKFSNWRRKAKVPILLLNTTSLNSGHNFHFTASWMGEPPGLTGDEVDVNERYRRLYYHEASTTALKDFPLAWGVAASSCVPALFSPLVLKGLYPGRTLRLVDGGVHDNQGAAGLLDESCSFIICSDASGQMDDQTAPADGMLGVFYRSDSILQDRLRESQYQDLRWRADSRALNGLFFIHLKQDLRTEPISWVGCEDEPVEPAASTRAPYGVDREIQRLLAEVRTDLDTFTDVEAYALMASGYLMTEWQLKELDTEHRKSTLPGDWGGFDVHAPRRRTATGGDYWPFMPLVPILGKAPWSSDERRHDLAEQLRVGKALFGKVWKLCTPLRGVAIFTGLAALIAAVACIVTRWNETAVQEITVGAAAIALVLFVGSLLVPLLAYLDVGGVVRKAVTKVVLATAGWAATRIHLAVFDPMFRARGSLERLLKLPGK